MLDGASSLGEGDFFDLGSILQVLAHSEVERERVVFGHVANAAFDEVRVCSDGDSANFGVSGSRSVVAG